jgi:hypothetical protein
MVGEGRAKAQYSEALFAGGNPELIRKANARVTAKRKQRQQQVQKQQQNNLGVGTSKME